MDTERRKHRRFNVLDGLAEPITLDFNASKSAPAAEKKLPQTPLHQPALMTNLSAGGMSLLLFSEPLKAKQFEMTLNLPGLSRVPVDGKIVHINKKGETYSIGIAFTKLAKKVQTLINKMAEDNGDCDTRISLRLPDACVPTCCFHGLCAKPHKGSYWKDKKD